MSGEYITLADAIKIKSKVAPGPATSFYVDIVNLQAYINETSADRLYIDQAINDDGTPTLVLTCYAAGNPLYHMDASGNQCVMEHISTTPPPGII